MSVNDLRIGILEGTITKDTELKHSETTHKPYVQFCIASNKSIKKNGNYEKDTVFFDLCLFGKMAEVYDVSAGTIQNARNIFGIKGWQTIVSPFVNTVFYKSSVDFLLFFKLITYQLGHFYL